MKAELKLANAKLKAKDMEIDFLKTRYCGKEAGFTQIRYGAIYEAIKELHAERITLFLACANWEKCPGPATTNGFIESSAREIDDKEIAKRIEEIYKADPAKGYRRIADDLRAPNKKIYPDTKPIAIGDGRVLHLCRVINIKSTIKYAPKGCTQRVRSCIHCRKYLE